MRSANVRRQHRRRPADLDRRRIIRHTRALVADIGPPAYSAFTLASVTSVELVAERPVVAPLDVAVYRPQHYWQQTAVHGAQHLVSGRSWCQSLAAAGLPELGRSVPVDRPLRQLYKNTANASQYAGLANVRAMVRFVFARCSSVVKRSGQWHHCSIAGVWSLRWRLRWRHWLRMKWRHWLQRYWIVGSRRRRTRSVQLGYRVNCDRMNITSRAGGRHDMTTPLQVDLLTFKVVSKSRMTWATSVPILVFLGLSVLDLGPMYATDRRQMRIIA